MKLKVIVDNNTYIDLYYCGEPAVCYYIEDENTKMLLDVGYSDLFLKNMKKMALDIDSIDKIIISHGHDDHTRGLKYLLNENNKSKLSVIAHPNTFDIKLYEGEKICSPFLKDEMEDRCELVLSKEPVKVSEHITFLGEIPQIVEFEPRAEIGQTIVDNELVDDALIDDSALVYEGEKGIYIISGCSHSGICNIIEYAKKVTNCDIVLGVIGGFHLFEVTERVKKTVEYFKENNIEALYPCHCTSFKVRAAMDEVIEVNEVGVGLTIEWK